MSQSLIQNIFIYLLEMASSRTSACEKPCELKYVRATCYKQKHFDNPTEKHLLAGMLHLQSLWFNRILFMNHTCVLNRAQPY